MLAPVIVIVVVAATGLFLHVRDERRKREDAPHKSLMGGPVTEAQSPKDREAQSPKDGQVLECDKDGKCKWVWPGTSKGNRSGTPIEHAGTDHLMSGVTTGTLATTSMHTNLPKQPQHGLSSNWTVTPTINAGDGREGALAFTGKSGQDKPKKGSEII